MTDLDRISATVSEDTDDRCSIEYVVDDTYAGLVIVELRAGEWELVSESLDLLQLVGLRDATVSAIRDEVTRHVVASLDPAF